MVVVPLSELVIKGGIVLYRTKACSICGFTM